MTHISVEDLIIGTSSVAQGLREVVCRAAPRMTPVLIQGPTGAGKELVARGLHAASGRHGRFIAFNAAAIPESLFESELLGHVRGAFSGAVRDRAGLLRSARHGTAFVDEIGELPIAAQAKLLRVLDTHEVWPVGSDAAEQIDFRLVAATNANLKAIASARLFRDDLVHRLRGIVITVPALRDHVEDIAPLVEHFAKAIAPAGREIVITPSALRCLEAYGWPGNVRELRYAIEHAAFLSDDMVITETHIERVLAESIGTGGNDMPVSTDSLHRRALLALLNEHGGNVRAVALALGVTRSTAYRRMHRLGLLVPRRGPRLRSVDCGTKDSVNIEHRQ